MNMYLETRSAMTLLSDLEDHLVVPTKASEVKE
jgi:hypothetical protein